MLIPIFIGAFGPTRVSTTVLDLPVFMIATALAVYSQAVIEHALSSFKTDPSQNTDAEIPGGRRSAFKDFFVCFVGILGAALWLLGKSKFEFSWFDGVTKVFPDLTIFWAFGVGMMVVLGMLNSLQYPNFVPSRARRI